MKFSVTLNKTITMMITASTTSPVTAETTLAMSRMTTSGLAKKRRSESIGRARRVGTGSLNPNASRRRRASALVRPDETSDFISSSLLLKLPPPDSTAVLGLFAATPASDEAHDHGGQFVRIDWLGDVRLEAGPQGARPVLGSSIVRKRHRRDVSSP